MITFPPNELTVGDQTLRLGCRMEEMGAGSDYRIGDQLRGKITIYPYLDMEISSLECRLEFFIDGKNQASSDPIIPLRLSTARKLEGGKQISFPFSYQQRFGRANSLETTPQSYWRLKVIISPKAPFSDSLLDTFKATEVDFSPVFGHYTIPVVTGKGSYRVKSRNLPVRHFKNRELLFLLAPIIYLAFTLLFEGSTPTFQKIQLVGLAITLVSILLLLSRLSGFKDTPMELAPQRDGKLRICVLDRGDGSWKKASVGLRLVAKELITGRRSEKVKRVNLYSQIYDLADIGIRKDHLVEATLPWPATDLPTSYERDRQGYTWEVFLRVPGFGGGTQEQSWPVSVSWEPFQLPGEIVPTAAEGASTEETLELHPLKEVVRLKNGGDG